MCSIVYFWFVQTDGIDVVTSVSVSTITSSNDGDNTLY